MKRILALFILLVTTFVQTPNAQADASELEKFYLNLSQQIGQQLWLGYQRKLLQLLETYTPRTDRSGAFIEYSTMARDVCLQGSEPGVVYKTTVGRVKKNNSQTVNIEHFGCGDIRLKEFVKVTGDGQYEMSSLAAFTGIRPYSAPEGQERLIYEVRTQFDEVLFRIQEEHTKIGRQLQYYIKDQLVFLAVYNEKKQTIFANTYGFEVEWRFGTSSRWAITKRREESGIFAYMGSQGQILFLGANSGLDRSLAEFRGFFSGLILMSSKEAVFDLLALIDRLLLPKSEFSNAGGANEELIQKFEEIIEQLQRNDVQTVILELIQILDDIEAGKIRVLE